MGIRRTSREAALQFLYQEDYTKSAEQPWGYDLEERFGLFCSLFQINRKAREYALVLLRGVCRDIEEIDSLIETSATNWRLTRIAATDRNLLRIAVWEIVKAGDVPAEVAIDEAVEIAKRFAGDESPKFINGVLDAVRTKI